MKTAFFEETISNYVAKLRYLRRSENTIKVYLPEFKNALNHFGERINTCTKQDIENYVNQLNCNTASHQNTVINAIKFYFEKVMDGNRTFYFNIDRPKREFKIPDILTPTEVMQMVQSTANIKHKAMLKLCYSCALRNSEVRQIKLNNVDWKASLLKIVEGKGKRDRIVKIPADTLELLKQYYIKYIHKKYNPNNLLFMGEKHLMYSSRSLQCLVSQAMLRIKCNKHIHPHSLRHSRATHLKNAGVDIYDLKKLLGHRDIKVTELYLHIAIEEHSSSIDRADELIQLRLHSQKIAS